MRNLRKFTVNLYRRTHQDKGKKEEEKAKEGEEEEEEEEEGGGGRSSCTDLSAP